MLFSEEKEHIVGMVREGIDKELYYPSQVVKSDSTVNKSEITIIEACVF